MRRALVLAALSLAACEPPAPKAKAPPAKASTAAPKPSASPFVIEDGWEFSGKFTAGRSDCNDRAERVFSSIKDVALGWEPCELSGGAVGSGATYFAYCEGATARVTFTVRGGERLEDSKRTRDAMLEVYFMSPAPSYGCTFTGTVVHAPKALPAPGLLRVRP